MAIGEGLFPPNFCTYSTHVLLHFPAFLKLWGPAPFFSEFASERMMGSIKRAGKRTGVSVEYTATKAFLRQEKNHCKEFYNSLDFMANRLFMTTADYTLEKPFPRNEDINLNLVEICNVVEILLQHINSAELRKILQFCNADANRTTRQVVDWIGKHYPTFTWLYSKVTPFKVFRIEAENYSLSGRGLEFREVSNSFPTRHPIAYGSSTYVSTPTNYLNESLTDWFSKSNLNSWCICNDLEGMAMQVNGFFTLQQPSQPEYQSVVDKLTFAFVTARKADVLELGDHAVRVNLQMRQEFFENKRVASISEIICLPTVSICFDDDLLPIRLRRKARCLDDKEESKRSKFYSDKIPENIIPRSIYLLILS